MSTGFLLYTSKKTALSTSFLEIYFKYYTGTAHPSGAHEFTPDF